MFPRAFDVMARFADLSRNAATSGWRVTASSVPGEKYAVEKVSKPCQNLTMKTDRDTCGSLH